MCLILFALKAHPRYPFVLAANRDEFYGRPSAVADFWQEAPDVLAGRDLKDGGTWLGITKKGRFAALTNYRDPSSFMINAPSRGLLVRNYLTGREEPEEYFRNLAGLAHKYNGFSLLVGDLSRLVYFSNRGCMQSLSPGIYGLSNSLLDTSWPKVERGKKVFGEIVSKTDVHVEDIFDLLADCSKPKDELLPNTGVGLEWERVLSSLFISSPTYGTRSSTVILIDSKNHLTFLERVFNSHPSPWLSSRFEFRVGREKGTEIDHGKS